MKIKVIGIVLLVFTIACIGTAEAQTTLPRGFRDIGKVNLILAGRIKPICDYRVRVLSYNGTTTNYIPLEIETYVSSTTKQTLLKAHLEPYTARQVLVGAAKILPTQGNSTWDYYLWVITYPTAPAAAFVQTWDPIVTQTLDPAKLIMQERCFS